MHKPNLYIFAGCNGAGKTTASFNVLPQILNVMSEQEIIERQNFLNKALKESFQKMIELKKKLGLPVVTTDQDGKTIVISAEEADRMARAQS